MERHRYPKPGNACSSHAGITKTSLARGAWRVQRGPNAAMRALDSWFKSNPARQAPAVSKEAAGYLHCGAATSLERPQIGRDVLAQDSLRVGAIGRGRPRQATIMERWPRGLWRVFAKHLNGESGYRGSNPRLSSNIQAPVNMPETANNAGVIQWQNRSLPNCRSGVRFAPPAPLSRDVGATVSIALFQSADARAALARPTNWG